MKELRAIQRANGYIPATALHELSERTGTPLYQIQGVVSFYPHFRTTPRATRRGAGLRRSLLPPARRAPRCSPRRRSAWPGRRRPAPSSAPSSCLGRCDRAPACAVNDVIVTRVTRRLADGRRRRGGRRHPAARRCRSSVIRASSTSIPTGPASAYGAARKLAASGDTDALIASLKASDLRGLGGAGFPHRPQVGDRAQRAGRPEVHRLQRRRERAGHDQGPLHHEQRRRICWSRG